MPNRTRVKQIFDTVEFIGAAIFGATARVTGQGAPMRADVADGAIPAYALCEIDASGDLVVGTANSLRIVGANIEDDAKVATEAITLVSGYNVTLTAAAPIAAGKAIKAAASGKACHHVDALTAASTIKAVAAGGNFGNQPANDGIEVVSSAAGDTTQTLTLIGTTDGGTTVVVETVTLNGTSQVSTTKTDWGVLLAAKLSAATTGNITVREASANGTITTITAGTLTAGVNTVTAASQGGHNVIPTVVADGASTKVVGVKYVQNDGTTTAYQAVALNGTTAAAFGTAALLVTEVYNGDVATGTAITVAVGSAEDGARKVGKALTSAAAGATFLAYVRP